MSKNINKRHHIIPSSRGGPNADWNLCYFRLDKENSYFVTIDVECKTISPEEMKTHVYFHAQTYHCLFRNLLPSEIIFLIKNRWTKADGSLNRVYIQPKSKKMSAWIRLFGEESVSNTQCAVDFMTAKFMPIEERWLKTNVGQKNRNTKKRK